MSTQEARQRANYKYVSGNVKQINLKFYPKDHDLLDKAKKGSMAKGYESFTEYILDLIKADLGE